MLLLKTANLELWRFRNDEAMQSVNNYGSSLVTISLFKLDVTLKGTTMHPRWRHIGACWDLLEWFQLFGTSKNTSQIQFRTLKKNLIFWFPCCSTREDLSVDVSITNVGLILTKPGWFFSRLTETRGTDRIQFRRFRTFWKKIYIFGFPWCSIREDLSIDASITNVGLILTKLRWFQLFVKNQNSNFELFKNKQTNFGVSIV